MLDTNVISEHLKRPSGLTHRFIQYSGRLALPTVVLGELYAWAYGRADPSSILTPLDSLLEQLEILPFDSTGKAPNTSVGSAPCWAGPA